MNISSKFMPFKDINWQLSAGCVFQLYTRAWFTS